MGFIFGGCQHVQTLEKNFACDDGVLLERLRQ